MNFYELSNYFNDRAVMFFECGKDNAASQEMEITAGSKHPNTARQAASHIIDSLKSGDITAEKINGQKFPLLDGACTIHLPGDFDYAAENDEHDPITQIVENMELSRR